MHKLEVGQPYHPNVTTWPEGAEYNFRAGQHELLIRLARLTPQEIGDARQGRSEFALFVKDELIVLCYRFGSMPWSNAPYSWHLVPADQQTLPELPATPQTRALLSVVLIEADTGLVRALRAVTFSPAYTRALHQAIRQQAARRWDAPQYDRQLAAIYGRHSSAELAQLAVARCGGGE